MQCNTTLNAVIVRVHLPLKLFYSWFERNHCCTTHLQTKKLLKSSVTVVFLIFLVFSDLLSFFRHRTRIRFHPFLSASTHADVSRSCYFKAQHLQLLQAEFLGDSPRRYSSAKYSEVCKLLIPNHTANSLTAPSLMLQALWLYPAEVCC